MTEQLAIESNAVIGDLEQELKAMKDRMEWWRDACEKSVQREKNLNGRLHITEPQADVEKLIRNILDEAEYEDDDENMRELRKTLWNDGDSEKQYQAEVAVPF